MRLYEYEAKKILADYQIPVPRGKVIKNPDSLDGLVISFESTAVKAQVLSGRRAQAGGIKLCRGLKETKKAVGTVLGSSVGGEVVRKVLVEQHLASKKEYYLAVAFDTANNSPLILTSGNGGSGIEESLEQVVKKSVDHTYGLQPFEARELFLRAGFQVREVFELAGILLKLWRVFQDFQARLLEVNPLIRLEDGSLEASDAKMIIDDEAASLLGFKTRGDVSRFDSARARAAKKIDRQDYRGTAGSVYLDLDGNIAILASGGGGSLVSLDALVYGAGLKPANYTEYSGNPSREKVARLTKIVFSKPGLKGGWVVGGRANFTDIYETLSGFLEGLRTVKPKPTYPIVIRRGGPRCREAFSMLRQAAKQEGYNLHLFDEQTSILRSAQVLKKLIKLK